MRAQLWYVNTYVHIIWCLVGIFCLISPLRVKIARASTRVLSSAGRLVHRMPSWKRFSKVSPLLNLLCKITVQLTFENFCAADYWEWLRRWLLKISARVALFIRCHLGRHSQKSAHYQLYYVKSLCSWLLRISARATLCHGCHLSWHFQKSAHS